jgi:hypothetical protein
MKPLPEAVQAAFPCAPDRFPPRPWWDLAPCLPDLGQPKPEPYYIRERDRLTTTETRAEADAEHPLPHPGFRAGQVWAHESGESITILRAISTRVWAGDSTVGETPSAFAREYPYLMADPACPWLAPWSPAEKAKP